MKPLLHRPFHRQQKAGVDPAFRFILLLLPFFLLLGRSRKYHT
jgi:hypothetical protein